MVFPTARGHRRTKDDLNRRIVHPAYLRAQALAKEREVNPLPAILSSRTGRRTAITLFLEAGYDPHYVQDLVGHEDSRTTMDIYRQRRNLPKDERVIKLMSRPDVSKEQEAV